MSPSTSTTTEFDQYRRTVQVGDRPVSVVDTGEPGPAALFVHGVGTSSYLWRNVFAALRGERRCVAIDLPVHGGTPALPGEDLHLGSLAAFVADCCDALELDGIDLVANDTGGAVAQLVAVGRPQRLRSLTLTNCDTQGNLPPKAFMPAVLLAKAGLLAPLSRRLRRDPARAKRRVFGSGYQDLAHLDDDVVHHWFAATSGTAEAARRFQHLIAGLDDRELRAIEPDLRALQVPTLIVWGTDDVFFDKKWAYWLRDTIPGATEVVEIEDGRLFFPDERADELVAALRRHWT